MLEPSHLRTSSRELEATTGAAAHNLDEEHSRLPVFGGSWDTRGQRSGAKSASPWTGVFSQRYALAVVQATIGLAIDLTVCGQKINRAK